METLKKYKYDISIILIGIMIMIFINFNFVLVKVSGNSMSPTYHNGEIILLKKTNNPVIGDLIIFEAPNWDNTPNKLIKRIAGLENDEIYINDTKIIINNNETDHLKRECYINKTQRIFLDKGEYFVAGDNKENSNDSIYRYCIGENYEVLKENVYAIGKEFLILRR